MHGLDGGRLSSALRLITAIRRRGRTYSPRTAPGPGHSDHRALLLDDALPWYTLSLSLEFAVWNKLPFSSMPYDSLAADDKHMRRSYASGYTMRSGIRNLY